MRKILFIIITMFICITSASADSIELDSNGVTTDGSKMETCTDYQGYVACHMNNNDMGYRYTIIGSNGYKIANTNSVDYFDDHAQTNVPALKNTNMNNSIYYFRNEKYYTLSTSKMTTYYKNYKISNGTLGSTTSSFKRQNLGGKQYLDWEKGIGIVNLGNMVNEVIKGKSLFESILIDTGFATNLNINTRKKEFAQGNYKILIEPIYVIYYNTSAYSTKYKYVMGTTSDIAKHIRTEYIANYSASNKGHFHMGLTVNFIPNLAYNVCSGSVCYPQTIKVSSQNKNNSAYNENHYQTVIDNLYKIYTTYGYGTTTISGKEIDIETVDTCVTDFKKLIDNKNPVHRIELFQKYKTRTNLLNFDITDPNEACSAASCNSLGLGCISGGFNSNFSATNLSCYAESIEIKGLTAFCGYEFNLSSSLTSNSGFGKIKAGQLLLFSTTANNPTATGKLTKVCYTFASAANDPKITENINTFDIGNLSSDVGSLYIDGNLLKVSKLEPQIDNYSKTETNFYWYIPYTISYDSYAKAHCANVPSGAAYDSCYETTKRYREQSGSTTDYIKIPIYRYKFSTSVTKNYYLNPVYAKMGSAEIIYNTSAIDNTYKFIGYGIPTNLNKDLNGNKYGKTVSISLYKTGTGTYCPYEVIPGIVEDNKPKLEFRTISKSNPFTGKKGSGRDTGSNWCNGNDCSSENDVVKSVIYNRNDSYNSTGAGPKYTIKLKPNDIKYIRENYNDKPYDEFYLECDANATNCKSKLLEDLKTKGLIEGL